MPWTSPTSRPSASSRHQCADALAGLRANEARYFKNKYDHVFTVEPAGKAKKTIAWVHEILESERDLVIASTPLEASEFEVAGIHFAYVFYESGLSINVMYTVDDGGKASRGLQALRRHGGARGAGLEVQVREAEVEAGGNHPRLVLRDQGRALRRLYRFALSDPSTGLLSAPAMSVGEFSHQRAESFMSANKKVTVPPAAGAACPDAHAARRPPSRLQPPRRRARAPRRP